MCSLVVVVYSANAYAVQSFCNRFKTCFNIVVVYNGSDNEFFVSDVELVIGSNVFREFSGYVEGARRFPAEEGLVYFCNDTLILNKQSWKLKFLLTKTQSSRVTISSMFGFLDSTFNMSGKFWFVRNKTHLRSDVFALNKNGIGVLESLMSSDLEALYSIDVVFREVCDDFIRVHHPSKSGQNKGLATYIEVSLSQTMFDSGLIVDCSTIVFKTRNHFDSFVSRIIDFCRHKLIK